MKAPQPAAMIFFVRHFFAWAIAATFLLDGLLAQSSEISITQLQGKWSLTKTNSQGNRVGKTMEFQNDDFLFHLLDADEKVRVVAKGKTKVEKLGAFTVLTMSNIRGGRSADDLNDVDDVRPSIIRLRDDELIVASNLDKDRVEEKPQVEIYTRVKSEGETELLGNWDVDLTIADRDVDYLLRLAKKEGKLAATMVSPRSGEYPCKNVSFQNGQLKFELDREIQGNEVTLVFVSTLKKGELVGTALMKGGESEFSGNWKATKQKK